MSAVTIFQKLSQTLKPRFLVSLVSVLAIFGTVVMISGGVWDAISHALREPEFFWTIQHITVYAGVAMTSSAGILGSALIINKQTSDTLKKGIKIIIIGSAIQIISGLGDSISHDVFGIDGLVSLTHQPLEFGLILSALGGFLIIKSNNNKKLTKFLPFSILTLILAISWLGFNLALIVGGPILCLPIYEMFSSGCAIL